MPTNVKGSAVSPSTTGSGSTMTHLSKYKLVFLGDTQVGKTSIITRYLYDHFDLHAPPTVGIDFLSKTMYLEDRTVRLQIWDTAGQERFRSLMPSYIRDSHVALVVYDVTNRASFLNIAMWIDQVRTELGNDAVIFLVGNKTDLSGKRKVGAREGEDQAKKEGMIFMECSAKSGYNVRSLFRKVATTLTKKKTEQNGDGVSGVESKKKDVVNVTVSAVDASGNAGGRLCGC